MVATSRNLPLHLLIYSSELPPGGYGSATSLRHLLDGIIVGTSWRVTIVAPRSRLGPCLVPTGPRLRLIQVRTVERRDGSRNSRLGLVRYPLDSTVVMRRLPHEPPHAVLAWQLLPAGPPALLAGAMAEAPVLLRTSGPELAPGASPYPMLSLAASPLVRTLASRATAIIVKSPAERRLLRRSAVPGPIVCIPNAVLAHGRPRRADSFPCVPDHRTVRLVAVARLERSKGVRVLLGALRLLGASLHRHQLTVVGDGRQRASLEELARRQGLPVRFLGRVPHDRLPAIYARNDVLVLPSAHEGCSNAALEAMAAGLPVVGTPAIWSGLTGIGFPAEIVAPFGDEDALARAIAAVRVPATYRRLIDVGHRVAVAHSINALVDGYDQLLSKLLDNARLGRRR